MLSKEIIKKIAEIEIHTKRIMSSTLMGDSRSAQKGSGFEFNQIRDYQMGDDVRFIDWRSSAKSNKLLVKEYIEERNRTIIILLDISLSTKFTSASNTKADIMRQVAGVLAFVAGYSKDRVGIILYSDQIECVVPPATGHAHVHAILEHVFSHETRRCTDASIALERLMKLKKRNAMVFMISDCIDDHLDITLKKASRIYDIVMIRCLDAIERSLPVLGFLPVHDPETGQDALLDLRGRNSLAVSSFLERRISEQRKLYVKYGVDCLDLVNNETFIADVVRFFRRRMVY